MIDQLLDMIAQNRKRIVVVGDAIWDRWMAGRIESCQDGCLKFVQESVCTTHGSAANAHQCLQYWGVNTDLFAVSHSARSVKTRYLVGGKIVWRHDADRIVSPSDYSWARDRALEMVGCAGAVLLSDYDKGFLIPEFIREMVEECRRRGVPCMADCKRAPEVYQGCILKGNLEWGSKYFGKGNVPAICVQTHANNYPRVWLEGEWASVERVWPEVECVNHVGAGDCFSAHLALALAYGFSPQEAAAFAHSAGRVYVQHPYNRAPYPREVAADMSSADEKTPADATQSGSAGVG